MSTTAPKPATTPIPVQLSAPEFEVFILPHLSMPKRGLKCTLSSCRVFHLILWGLSHCSAFSLSILHTHAAPHAARPLAFRLTLPHTGVPGAHGGKSPECVQYPWGSPRHEERMLWPEFRWIWRTKKT